MVRGKVVVFGLLLSFTWLVAACGVQTANVDLPGLLQAQSIDLQDNWAGNWDPDTINAQYTLTLQGNRFVGEARFSVGSYQAERLETVEAITVPQDVVQAFLQKLSRAPLKGGEYEPRIDQTDNYPSIKLSVVSPSLVATFSSESQGETHAPWQVKLLWVGDVNYVCPTGAPAEALAILDPYLKHDVLKTLTSQVRLLYQGKADLESGGSDTAIADFNQAIQVKPDSAQPYNYRGLAYDAKGDYERAIADYSKAIQLEPDLAEAYYNRALALREQGEKAEAIADLKRFLGLTSDPNLRKEAEQALSELGGQ